MCAFIYFFWGGYGTYYTGIQVLHYLTVSAATTTTTTAAAATAMMMTTMTTAECVKHAVACICDAL